MEAELLINLSSSTSGVRSLPEEYVGPTDDQDKRNT